MALTRLVSACLGIVLLASGLAACADLPGVNRVEVAGSDANGITLRWYEWEGSFEQARAEAEAHCRTTGRHAELIEEFTDGDVSTARFACR
jgi:hypothetical protein